MATTIYVDFLSGSDTTGDGLSATPYQSVTPWISAAGGAPYDVRIASTNVANSYVCDVLWTFNGISLTTSSSLTADINIGDYIGKPTAAGNGSKETYYRVTSINDTYIIIETPYWGDTETVSSIKKITPVGVGPSGTGSDANCIIIKNSTIITGGWNLSGPEPIQDGETWFKSNVINRGGGQASLALTYGSCIKWASAISDITVKKLNMVESCYGIIGSGLTTYGIYEDLTFIMWASCHYTYNLTTNNLRITNCVFNTADASSTTFRGSSVYNTIIEYCLFIGTGVAKTIASVHFTSFWSYTGTFRYNIFFNRYQLQDASNNNIQYEGTNKCYNMAIGFEIDTVGSIVKNLEFYNCNIGIQANINLLDGHYIYNCKFDNCNYGIYTTYNSFIAENCTFNNCSYGVWLQKNPCIIKNCSFSGISINAVYKDINGGNIEIINCTSTDIASKTYYIAAGEGPYKLLYTLNNAFGETGKIWGTGTKLKDYSVYRTSSPSLKIQWLRTSYDNLLPMKIMSTMINSGASATMNFYMKKNTDLWNGTLQPVWKLNEVPLQTETTLTSASLSTGWLPYSYSVVGSAISADGELSMEFIPNMLISQTIYLDDFTVTT